MQTILIEDKKNINIIGATRILTSTNTQAVVEIENNNLILTGTNLEITKLNLENKEVVFNGDLTSLKFSNKNEKSPLLKRLFK